MKAVPTQEVPAGAVVLLTGLVDYAGLFPPAARSMAEAVREYAAARDGDDAWVLGRFVVPAARLAELAEALAIRPAPPARWPVSAIGSGDPERDAAAIAAFNDGMAGRAIVDMLESKPQGLDGIGRLADTTAGRGLIVYVEVPLDADVDAWLASIAGHGLRAKIRTGGVTAAAFPAAAAVAAFLAAAVRAGVPFKATAGLHHPLRGVYALTYAPDAPAAPMYGYLNVLLAAAAVRAGAEAGEAAAILLDDDPATLAFAADEVRWRERRYPLALLHAVRADHLMGFGSCSFREPVDEGRSLIQSRR